MSRSTRHAHRRSLGVALSFVFVFGASACSSDSKLTSSTSPSGTTDSPNTSDTSSGASTDTTATAGGTDSSRAIVSSRIISEATKVGYTLDEACVATLVAKLSAADLELLADAAADTSPDATTPPLSSEGEALANSILDCSQGSGNQDLINQAAAVVLGQESGSSLDKDCVTKQLATLSDEQLQLIIDSGPESTDPRLGAAAFALFECLGTPGSDTAST